jgi:hypothetical protein
MALTIVPKAAFDPESCSESRNDMYILVKFSTSNTVSKRVDTLEENRPVAEEKSRNRNFDATYGSSFLISRCFHGFKQYLYYFLQCGNPSKPICAHKESTDSSFSSLVK